MTPRLSRAEYEALMERLEDLEDALAADRHRHDETIPFEITARIVRGEHPVAVWRDRRGLTQRQLAERAGLSPAMVSEVEKRNRTPSLPMARAIAGALGVGLDDLFGDDAGAEGA